MVSPSTKEFFIFSSSFFLRMYYYRRSAGDDCCSLILPLIVRGSYSGLKGRPESRLALSISLSWGCSGMISRRIPLNCPFD